MANGLKDEMRASYDNLLESMTGKPGASGSVWQRMRGYLRDDGEAKEICFHDGPRRRGVDLGELGAGVLALDERGGLVVGEVRDLEVAVEFAEDRVVRRPVGAFFRVTTVQSLRKRRNW